MDKQQHIHELIDQYLNGELIGQELDKFKIRLKDDPAFLNQVQVQKAIIKSVETARRNELKAMLVDAKKPKKGFIIPFGNRSLAVAASILSLLAFGLIIKTMLPQGGEELSQADKTEQVKTEEPEENQKPVPVTDSAQIATTFKNDEQDSMISPPPPEIAMVEVVEDDEAIDDARVLTTDSDEVDFAELKKNEDEIDGDKFKAKRDSMLGSKNVMLLVVAYEVQESTQTTDVKRAKKDGLFNRKSKDKTAKETEDAESVTTKSLKTSPSFGIRVEFWESIVNFKGYKFDGKKLLLFDTPVSTPVAIKSFTNTTYLNKAGTWYMIVPNNSFNQMVRVSNAEVLKVLNSK